MKSNLIQNKKCRPIMAVLLAVIMIVTTVNVNNFVAYAASKPKLQKTKLQLAEGKTAKLKIKKMPKGSKVVKTKWKVQKKKILKLTISGSKTKKKKAKAAKIKALKAGKSAVYCTITYRVKKSGKWKTKKNKLKAVVTVVSANAPGPDEAENPGTSSDGNNTPAPSDSGNPSGDGNGSEGGNTAAPQNSSTPGSDSTSTPQGTSDPNGDSTSEPQDTSAPDSTNAPQDSSEPADSTNAPQDTSEPDDEPQDTTAPDDTTATPAITPNPNAETLTWTGLMVRSAWTQSSGNIDGSYRQDTCSDGLSVLSENGCWYFKITSTKWDQYNYPVLKCYRAEGDTTTDALEVWYGNDPDVEEKVTYPFGEWNEKGIALDKTQVSDGVIISNYTPIGKIEICEGEAPASGETDIGSDDFSKTALEFSKNMKIGWNVGNSLDATSGKGYASGTNGLTTETAWGNPKITEGLIKAVKEAGFNTIRVPVTWLNHTDPDNNYQIDETWMNRVEEVVQYCTSNGLYVLLNVHHDGSDDEDSGAWLGPHFSDTDAMKARYKRIWEQIAERFKDYSNLLLFESMNEFHHGYNAPLQSYYDVQNELHQIFVNTVRASGGNNEKRYLIIPGYNTDIDKTIAGLKQLPTDSCADHLMVEVHYYDPYTFATDVNETQQWGKDHSSATATDADCQEEYLITQLKKMKDSYVDKGIPVIIGEFGAPAKEAANEKYRVYYLQHVVKYCVEYGLVPVYWDNDSGNTYGLFNRNTYEIVRPEILNGMMAALEPGYTIPIP